MKFSIEEWLKYREKNKDKIREAEEKFFRHDCFKKYKKDVDLTEKKE